MAQTQLWNDVTKPGDMFYDSFVAIVTLQGWLCTRADIIFMEVSSQNSSRVVFIHGHAVKLNID